MSSMDRGVRHAATLRVRGALAAVLCLRFHHHRPARRAAKLANVVMRVMREHPFPLMIASHPSGPRRVHWAKIGTGKPVR